MWIIPIYILLQYAILRYFVFFRIYQIFLEHNLWFKKIPLF
jgi:hypothetical protein